MSTSRLRKEHVGLQWITLGLFIFITSLSDSAWGDESGPVIVMEPKSRVDFINSTGATLYCSAKGQPAPSIIWTLSEDSSTVGDVPGLRKVLSNGTLIFSPFRDGDYSQEVHDQVYRCVAVNIHGTVLSRDVHVRAVAHREYSSMVLNEYVISGNSALLKCSIPSYVADFVDVHSWVSDEGETFVLGGHYDGKYLVLHSGELYIRYVTPKDGERSYRCQTVNRLIGETRLSTTAGKVVITEPLREVAPRHLGSNFSHVTGSINQDLTLVCPLQGYPEPYKRWYKFKENGSKSPVERNEWIEVDGDTLIIINAKVEDSGKYLCEGMNTVGVESIETVLIVTASLAADVEPSMQAVEIGHPATFTCSSSGNPINSSRWYKDGRPIVTSSKRVQTTKNDKAVLHIPNVSRDDIGMYQCIVRNNQESAQGAAELKLGGESPPKFKIQYRNQTAQRGDDVLLECEAEGEKPIGILWSKDRTKLDANQEERYRIHEKMSSKGLKSSLSIKKTDRSETAIYSCVATNAFGSADTNINLIIQERPEQPYDLKVPYKSGRAVELSWTPPYNGNSPITRYIVEYKISKQNWKSGGEMVMAPGQYNMATVFDLRPATTYHFRIYARNKIGDSNPSDSITIITAEEAPSGPPRDLKVEVVNDTNLLVTWKPPLKEEWNGDIQGYQVVYRLTPTNRDYAHKTVEFVKDAWKKHHVVISNFYINREYTVLVSAFNKAGQGPRSAEVKVHTAKGTLQKQPQEPFQDVSCTTLTSQSIRIAWKSPPLTSAQGVIKYYKVIYGPAEQWFDDVLRSTKTTKNTEMDIHGLQKYTNYSLEVLATTSGGEEVRSPVIHCKTEQDCIPTSSLESQLQLVLNQQQTITKQLESMKKDIALIFVYLRSKEDAGNDTYSPHENHQQGATTAAAPPHPPEIQLLSTTINSIEIKLKASVVDDTTPIDGYLVFYKPEFMDFEHIEVPASTRSYVLKDLWCGSRYQIYAKAFNKVTGEPSDMLNTRTEGKKPIVPDVNHFVEVSSSSVTLHLNAWKSECRMNYFVVEYKLKQESDWKLASNQVAPTRNYVIMDLIPASWYNLRISAHNNAGSSVAEYEFATLTPTGDTIDPA